MKRQILLLLAILMVLLVIGNVFWRGEQTEELDDRKQYVLEIKHENQGTKEDNAWPKVRKAKLGFESVGSADTVKVIIQKDPDAGRDISYKYEWFKNGKPFGGNADSATGFKKGDRIDVKITPFDEKRYGQPVFLYFDVVRVPPKVVENKTISFDGMTLSYQVKAIDPDGGKLTYSLVDAPENVVIDSESGLIKWHVKAEESGKCSVNVKIRNSAGAEVVCPLALNIGEG